MKRNIFTLMVLLWMGIIFWFSAQPADQSERMSLSVGHVAGLLFVDGYEDWPQERQEAFEEEIDHRVRKAAHFTEYAILGLLLTAMYRAYGHEGKRLFLLAAGTSAPRAPSCSCWRLESCWRTGRGRSLWPTWRRACPSMWIGCG